MPSPNPHRVFVLFLAAFFFVTAFVLTVPAQDQSEVYRLGEVVVTAQTGGVEATQTVAKVTAEDIKSKNAATLEEAVALLPGVSIRSGGEGVPRIDIRGFKTRHVLLLLDGIPINSAFDQQFDPSIIPTENIAAIKMTTGPNSVLYGPGALGGVINIITKKGTQGLKGMMAGEIGDRQSYLGKASVSGATGKFDYFVSGSAYKRTAYPMSGKFDPTPVENGGYRENSDHERNNLFANIGYSATSYLTLGLTAAYHQGQYGMPASVILNPSDAFASKPKYERIDDFRGFSVQLAADFDPDGPLSMRSWFFTNQLQEKDNTYDNAAFNSYAAGGSARLTNDCSIKGLSLQPRYDLGRAGILTAALSAEKDRFEQSGFQMKGGGSGTGGGTGGGGGGGGGSTPTSSTVEINKDLSLYSIGLEYEVSPFAPLGLVIGYGHHFQSRSEKSDHDFSLLIGAHYDILKNTRVKAAFNRNIRFPSMRQLYDAKSGNLNLQTEVAYLYQLGLEQKLPGKSSLGLTGFYTDATNFIEKIEQSSLYENFEKDRFIGFEAAAETRFAQNLLLRGSYTYLYSEDLSDSGKDVLQYRPKDKLALEGKYDFDFGLTPYVSLTYVANQYFYSKAGAGPLQKGKLNNYSLVDFKLNQQVIKDKISVYVGVKNVFDINYETSYGYPQAGRFIYGGIELATTFF